MTILERELMRIVEVVASLLRVLHSSKTYPWFPGVQEGFKKYTTGMLFFYLGLFLRPSRTLDCLALHKVSRDRLSPRLSPRQIISQRQIILWKLSMLGLTSIHPPSGCKLAPIALQWQVINHTWMGDNEDFVSIWHKHPVKYVVLLGKRGILYILGRMQKV